MTLSLRPFSSLARAVLFKTNTVALPTGFIFGLTLSQASTTSVGIAAGSCRDSTDADNMVLGAFTKTTGAWAVGTGNGGLDTGSIAASTWYHAYVIKTVAGLGGSTDALISLSATSPTMPTGYALKRRIGSVLTDISKHIILFQQDGDDFYWASPVGDVSATNPGTSAVTRTLTVPTGVRVKAKMSIAVSAGSAADSPTGIYVSDLSNTDIAPAAPAPLTAYWSASIAGTFAVGGQAEVWTNTSAQVRSRLAASGATTAFYIGTLGWVDQRGRLY